MLYARVEYKPFEPWTYRGIFITDENQKEVKRFSSGSFDEDFETYKEWAEHSNEQVELSSSIENFMWDRFSREYP